MEKLASIENKRSIKKRTYKFINGIKNDITDISFTFSYTGSIKKPEPMKINKNGFYDIDIDLNVSTDKSAQETYDIFQKAFKNNLRIHENMKSKRYAVIHIFVDQDGSKYNYDFAIFNLKGNSQEKKKQMVKNGTSYLWK